MNTNEAPNLCGLKREDFQTTVNGKKTDLYILKNKNGNEVARAVQVPIIGCGGVEKAEDVVEMMMVN